MLKWQEIELWGKRVGAWVWQESALGDIMVEPSDIDKGEALIDAIEELRDWGEKDFQIDWNEGGIR